MSNEIVVSADLHAATIMAAALVQMKESSFLSFPLRDMLDMNCWLATMPATDLNEYGVRSTGSKASLALQELVVTISRLQLNVECTSCTSPGFEELAQLLSSPEGVEDATMVANKVSNYITSLLGGELIETKIDRLLYNAARQCPHHEAYDPSFVAPAYKDFEAPEHTVQPLNFLVALLIVGSLLFVFIAVATVIVKCIVRRRHRKWIASLSQDEISNVCAQQVRAMQTEKALSRSTKSLATSKVIPLVVRVSMPFVILGNIGLFLSGHLSLGATVSIKAEIAGEELVVGDFFKFSMAYSVGEMWNAGAKSLAILILIFSGVWPYTKQCITFVLWFLPPTRCSTTRRGKIFLWLDVLAKWSMVDIFVLLCTLAAFRISIESPDGLAFLPDGFCKYCYPEILFIQEECVHSLPLSSQCFTISFPTNILFSEQTQFSSWSFPCGGSMQTCLPSLYHKYHPTLSFTTIAVRWQAHQYKTPSHRLLIQMTNVGRLIQPMTQVRTMMRRSRWRHCASMYIRRISIPRAAQELSVLMQAKSSFWGPWLSQ